MASDMWSAGSHKRGSSKAWGASGRGDGECPTWAKAGGRAREAPNDNREWEGLGHLPISDTTLTPTGHTLAVKGGAGSSPTHGAVHGKPNASVLGPPTLLQPSVLALGEADPASQVWPISTSHSSTSCSD